MSEIARCAWCRKEPDVLSDGTIICGKCPGGGPVLGPGAIEAWNPIQARILEARRKDFEAGIKSALGMTSVWQDQNRWFDDYLKAGK